VSGIKRIDPRRPIRVTPAGLRRIVLGDTGRADPSAALASTNRPAAKPLRSREAFTRWHMAVAHSDRARLDEHARQAIAAAAILAAPQTGVVAVILGEINEDLSVLGVDRLAILPDCDAARFQPERECAAISALIDAFKPETCKATATSAGA
jgi:electron transfer flavoprotein alpha subunit